MAPIKGPLKLQTICLEQISKTVLEYVSLCGRYNTNINNRQFQNLALYIKLNIPTLLHCNLFHLILKKMSTLKGEEINPEIIIFLMRFLISEDIRYLNFSDLIYAGSVDYEVLDVFETGLGDVFKYLPNLMILDLSTHKNEVSLPSSSYNILDNIGWHCPNLRILNLNNNNRVTNDCIRCLSYSDFRVGCPYLEEIYLQECSITSEIILWLLKTFPNLKKVGYGEMGTILQNYYYSFNSRRDIKPLNLTYIDNSDSSCTKSDRHLIDIISRVCPNAENVRIRVSDEDCRDLYKLRVLKKLELRFYTGVHHRVGRHCMDFLRNKGRHLSSLTIFCDELFSEHVQTIMTSCYRLSKLFLHCNRFEMTELLNSSKPHDLKVLSIRIGQHEMDETPYGAPLVKYFLETEQKLEEIYLMLICRAVNDRFFDKILSTASFSKLQIFVYDAPRRNRDLPVIPLGTDTAWNFIVSCPKLDTIGNLISWQVSDYDISELKSVVRNRNFDVNIINSLLNKINGKYF